MTALLLGALGLTLSLVVPGVLASARWPDRAPVAAIVLWQAITLAGILCALGVVLAGPQELIDESGPGKPVGTAALIAALAVATLIIIRLLVSLAGVSYRSRTRRARHRMLVDLLDSAERHGELPAQVPEGLRVLDGPLPFAYCLPGRRPRLVLSEGVLRVLDTAQVAAVIAHEQAHLRYRHALVMESFTAFYRAVPRPLRSRVPLDAVHLLLEMAADDAARARSGAQPLRSALSVLSDAVSPDAPDGMDSAGAARERRRRLDRLDGADSRSAALSVLAATMAVGLLVLPTVILVVPWLDRALTTWPL
ncbi:M56 family metallopeptidase [Actinoplanes sp. N902-109]|uniref:M56 family metallopeptidase n=1 Tax=Actinoplanes sp. (strain N902-109) TaxID=649831 RepID=UPI000329595F|nr:M56 family metallopeptidase [Actinoplanes sp. N902-109]AGL18093.1 peptidase M48 Ste24p [Actinoplanes sp. N902-109]